MMICFRLPKKGSHPETWTIFHVILSHTQYTKSLHKLLESKNGLLTVRCPHQIQQIANDRQSRWSRNLIAQFHQMSSGQFEVNKPQNSRWHQQKIEQITGGHRHRGDIRCHMPCHYSRRSNGWILFSISKFTLANEEIHTP